MSETPAIPQRPLHPWTTATSGHSVPDAVLIPPPASMSEPLDGLPSTAGVGAAIPDPLWVSALRGRVLAALTSATSLVLSGMVLVEQVRAVYSAGLNPETAAKIVTQASSTMDAGMALIVAAASLIGLIAAAGSKAREWARRLRG